MERRIKNIASGSKNGSKKIDRQQLETIIEKYTKLKETDPLRDTFLDLQALELDAATKWRESRSKPNADKLRSIYCEANAAVSATFSKRVEIEGMVNLAILEYNLVMANPKVDPNGTKILSHRPANEKLPLGFFSNCMLKAMVATMSIPAAFGVLGLYNIYSFEEPKKSAFCLLFAAVTAIPGYLLQNKLYFKIATKKIKEIILEQDPEERLVQLEREIAETKKNQLETYMRLSAVLDEMG